MCSMSVCYPLPVLVAVLALQCCWSAPASAQRSAAVETYTCAPSPPPNRQFGSHLTVPIMQLWSVRAVQYYFDDINWHALKKNYSYFVLELDICLCQVLDLSEEFGLSECTVLHDENT